MGLKHRHHLRKSEIQEINEELSEIFGDSVKDILGDNPEMGDLDDETKVILVDDRPLFFKLDDRFIPVLSNASSLPLKIITVDMGAIRHIINGADIMKPGIVDVDKSICSGDIVGVEDEKNHKLIAVGEALTDWIDLKGDSGRAVKNIHYVGDTLWDMSKGI